MLPHTDGIEKNPEAYPGPACGEKGDGADNVILILKILIEGQWVGNHSLDWPPLIDEQKKLQRRNASY